MHNLNILTVEKLVEGKIIKEGKGEIVSNVVIDSRNVVENSLFFALPGTSFDGHDFVKKASENGASAVIVTKLVEGVDVTQIKVEDTLKALYLMAKKYKANFNIPFISLTGSAGKTSTKDMIYSVLNEKFNARKTLGNFNSTTGVPLTLFNHEVGDEISVVEMGMDHLKEIEMMSNLVEPNVAVITNVGSAHIETLKTRENILKAKMEIVSGLKKGGLLIINGDNDMLSTVKDSENYKTIKFSIDNESDFKAEDVVYTSEYATFTVTYNEEKYNFKVLSPAKYSIYNALCAIYIGFYYGLSSEEIQNGLYNFKPSKHRMDIDKVNNITFIDDTYNANREALREALGLLYNVSGKNRKVAVLGDMYGLGEKSKEVHLLAGEDIYKSNLDLLITVGSEAKYFVEGFINAGGKKENTVYFSEKEDLINNIYDYIKEDDFVLFKASRGMGLEKVLEEVKKGGRL